MEKTMNIKKGAKIEDVTMKVSDNGGYIVSYCERIKSLNKNMNSEYNYKTEIFEDGKTAVDRMEELLKIKE